MKAENAIEVKDIKKAFKIYYDKGHTLKEKLLFRNRRTYEERVVLDGISFEVKKGEAIGLIGQNGCGKSTTLKLLTKIMYPDTGSIEMRGRVSSLIELGAGFHPDMSGRENIYINASIFGLTRKEIEQRLNDIIAFSELEEYIDNPVRTYSSGMYMRLAFSVAINVDADILLIDEILAVGDAAFQAKCFNKLKEIKAKGTTIVIVSHSLGQIEQICERSIWIQAGKIKLEGTPRDVHPVYLQYMSTKSEEVEEGDKKEEKIVRNEENSNIKVNEIYLIDSNGNITKNVKNRDKIELRIEFNSLISKSGVIAGIGIFRDDGLHCYGTTTKQDGIEPFTIKKGINHMSVCFESMELLAGDYSIDWALAEENGTQIIYVKNILTFNVYSFTQEIGAFSLKHYWIYQEDTEKK